MKLLNRIIGLGLLGLLFAAPALAQVPGDDLTVANVVEKVKRGVIRVMGIDVESPVAAGGVGGGSGFVFEVDYQRGIAYAITNHHVSGSSALSAVKFWDESQYKAEMIATEPGIDVSLLRIYGIPDESDLPEAERTIVPVVLGDSDQVMIGETAIAMGNPGSAEGINIQRDDPYDDFLLKQTVTQAVVAGRDTPLEFLVGIWRQNRNDLGMQYGTNFDYALRMQTPINGGNSGGPLFNARGEVIGINFYGGGWMYAQNHNWAVPINLAKEFVFSVIETGKFEKPWLGLDIIMPTNIKSSEDYVEFKDRYRQDEIRVYGVRDNSPAARAGFMKNDIILSVDGREFPAAEDVRLYVFDQDIGTRIEFLVERNKREITLWAEVGPKRKYDAEFSV